MKKVEAAQRAGVRKRQVDQQAGAPAGPGHGFVVEGLHRAELAAETAAPGDDLTVTSGATVESTGSSWNIESTVTVTTPPSGSVTPRMSTSTNL